MTIARASVILAASFALIAADQPAPSRPVPAPGEGVICALALYNAIAEIGRQCFPDQDQDFKTRLSGVLKKVDAYVLANSGSKPEDLEIFKRKQALLGKPKADVCKPDLMQLYTAAAKAGAADLQDSADKLLARPGKPTWGDCL